MGAPINEWETPISEWLVLAYGRDQLAYKAGRPGLLALFTRALLNS
jgi:hypothetical protein